MNDSVPIPTRHKTFLQLCLLSFKLLGWLLFKPSGWQRYITEIAPTLPPDFALTDVQPAQWRSPILWQLLLAGHGLWAIWVSLITICTIIFLDAPTDALLLSGIYALMLSLMGGIVGSLSVSVAFGITISIVGGIALSITVGLYNEVVFSMAENIAIVVMLNVTEESISIPSGTDQAWVTILIAVFTASLASNVMQSVTITPYRHSQHRQLGSIVIGIATSSLAIYFIIQFISTLAQGAAALLENGVVFSFIYDSLISLMFGLAIMLIWVLQTLRIWQGLFLGLIISILLIFSTLPLNQFQDQNNLTILIKGIHDGIENGLLYTLLFAFPYSLAKRIANPWAGLVAGIFGSTGMYIAFVIILATQSLELTLRFILIAFLMGISFSWWVSLITYPFVSAWNLILYRLDELRPQSPSLLSLHSAFWDEHQRFPLYGLESYLVMLAERSPAEAEQAIHALSRTRQKWAAQEAQIELDARRLENCQTVATISKAHRHLAAGELSSPISALLRSLSRISRDVEAALSQESNYNQRLALDAVEERLDGLLRELTRSTEPYALRFRPIAEQWRQQLADYGKALSEAVESRQEINNPYIIGIPLTEHQEIFVGRSDVSEQIERLLLDNRCPPLLLYGQRRTGKTSLLNNLGRLLPSTIIPLFVDLQGPASLAKNYEGFLYNISRAMLSSAKRHREIQLPILNREILRDDPFTAFDEWLDAIEQHLEPQQTILLTLDEFSALEHVFAKGLLDEASVLGMFRHIIQHRPRFKLLLSGSHTIDEFERWASYLINVRIVHLSYLQAGEALKLIEQPVKAFALRYEYAASQRVMEVTRCHPALIQLLCAEIVTLKNRQHVHERRLATISDVDAAIPAALQHGRFFFADIENNQVTPEGAHLLHSLANHGEGAIVSHEELIQQYSQQIESIVQNLLQRELVEPLGKGYRFQVEMVRRWFCG
ncbi:AAA family ATPase [Beggiatoa leptomitoformis]|uniref:ATP-binding protein n=1 Tax=Beggiatoa leptomitoformis TaxID=288004 RepID=A0A2N9Y9W6_9GAMM|nr:AAA family ATPase [Beggiatoa leptomitoformis]ALG67313.1 ATP-binding protein [Beggiatoa leptomitoformis]AUI67252.1 ATP-binding protein [Beggiatoa leptomitoformis]